MSSKVKYCLTVATCICIGYIGSTLIWSEKSDATHTLSDLSFLKEKTGKLERKNIALSRRNKEQLLLIDNLSKEVASLRTVNPQPNENESSFIDSANSSKENEIQKKVDQIREWYKAQDVQAHFDLDRRESVLVLYGLRE